MREGDGARTISPRHGVIGDHGIDDGLFRCFCHGTEQAIHRAVAKVVRLPQRRARLMCLRIRSGKCEEDVA